MTVFRLDKRVVMGVFIQLTRSDTLLSQQSLLIQ